MLLREVKLSLFLEARAGVAMTQDLEGRPILGELLRDTAVGRDDGLGEMLGQGHAEPRARAPTQERAIAKEREVCLLKEQRHRPLQNQTRGSRRVWLYYDNKN